MSLFVVGVVLESRIKDKMPNIRKEKTKKETQDKIDTPAKPRHRNKKKKKKQSIAVRDKLA